MLNYMLTGTGCRKAEEKEMQDWFTNMVEMGTKEGVILHTVQAATCKVLS